jgi:hypothetical protein
LGKRRQGRPHERFLRTLMAKPGFAEWRTLAKPNSIVLTKIDIAEAQLRAAVRMFFEGGHPAPVYTLANAAREIVTSIANQIGIETGAQDVSSIMGITTKDFVGPLVWAANFFKHADRDAEAMLMFDEDDVRYMLIVASCHFEDLTNGLPVDLSNGLPVEAKVFRRWAKALTPKITELPRSQQQLVRDCIRLFPGLRRAASLAEQKEIGLGVLKRALADPSSLSI